MRMRNSAVLCFLFMVVFAMTGQLHAGPMFSVHDIKGRALDIELISVSGQTVNFRRADSTKEFSVAMEQFDAESRTKITSEAGKMPPVLPKIEADVVIGKRRDKGQSYYMIKQEITCTVKLRNVSHDTPLPKLTGKVIFIGRNTRTPNAYTVMSVQEFPVELAVGAESSTSLEPFVTEYDGDNKGTGNVGGYQYSGYLMVFINHKKEVVFDETTDAGMRKALTANPKLLAAMAGYAKGAYLDEKMELKNQKLRPPEYRSQ